MQFSVWPLPARSIEETIDLADWADAHGWRGIWFADHFMPDTDDGTAADGDTHAAWAVLPVIATETHRLRLGPLVSPTTIHHPAMLAKRASSIDRISGGRFVLGLGAGWQANEHRAYGIELPDPGPRVDRFEEAVQIVRSLLDRPRTTFKGRYFNVVDAPCQPKPVQEHLPLLVGTSGPRMLRIAARYADEWNTWGHPAVARKRNEAFLVACDAVGRDPATMVRSVQALVFHTDRPDDDPKVWARVPTDRSLVGTTDELVDAIGSYRAMGFDEFILPDFNFGSSPARRRECYDRFREEVVMQIGATDVATDIPS